MKVLHVTNLYPYSDHSTYGIFVKEQIDSLEDTKLQSVFFINAKKDGPLAYLNSVKKIKKLHKEFDIIHCHHQFSVLPILIGVPKKKIIILSVLGDIEKRNFLNKFVYFIVKRRCNTIIFKNKLADKKGVLLPNGVDTNLFNEIPKKTAAKKLNLSIETKTALFVANGNVNNPIKRFDKFKQVIEGYNSSNPKFFIKPLILSKVNRELVPYYYNSADVMILTSDHEGSPNAVKEAMACNLPIVSTNVGDVSRLLENVENCFVSKNNAIHDLVEKLQLIDFNKKSNGRKIIMELALNQKSIALKLKKVYVNSMETYQNDK